MNIKEISLNINLFIKKYYLYILILLILLYITKYFYSINYKSYDSVTGVDEISYKKGQIGIENYQNLRPSKLNNKISTLDGLKLTNKKKYYHLLDNNLILPQGNTLPLQLKKQYQLSQGPNVDGTKNSSKNMFMFAYNQCKPECCPGTYSCSSGCICTNDNQKNFLMKRGNNKNYSNNGF
jgi:hypothetical protein